MMILDDLRNDIRHALRNYLDPFSEDSLTNSQKERSLKVINIIALEDPLSICDQLSNYLNSLSIPFFSWVPFLEKNKFINCINEALKQEKYQECQLLRALLQEKQQIINNLQQNNLPSPSNPDIENRLTAILQDLKLLKNENQFLYERLAAFDQKIKSLETENKQLLEHTRQTEETLNTQKIARDNYNEISVQHVS